MFKTIMKEFSARFMTEEDGAITVDWVVITAAAVILVAIMMTIIEDGTLTLAGSIFD